MIERNVRIANQSLVKKDISLREPVIGPKVDFTNIAKSPNEIIMDILANNMNTPPKVRFCRPPSYRGNHIVTTTIFASNQPRPDIILSLAKTPTHLHE